MLMPLLFSSARQVETSAKIRILAKDLLWQSIKYPIFYFGVLSS